jgi:hypothetical protein
MMDPLSITSGIAAILHIASTVVQYLIDTQTSEDRRKLFDEIGSLSGLLFVLKELAERAKCADPWLTCINDLNVRNGPLEQVKRALKCLEKKLQPGSLKSVGNRLAWPFQKKEIDDLLQIIERNKALFVLALQNDHL